MLVKSEIEIIKHSSDYYQTQTKIYLTNKGQKSKLLSGYIQTYSGFESISKAIENLLDTLKVNQFKFNENEQILLSYNYDFYPLSEEDKQILSEEANKRGWKPILGE